MVYVQNNSQPDQQSDHHLQYPECSEKALVLINGVWRSSMFLECVKVFDNDNKLLPNNVM